MSSGECPGSKSQVSVPATCNKSIEGPTFFQLCYSLNQGFHEIICFQQEGNWFPLAGETFLTELLYKLEELSFRWSNQANQFDLTAS